MLKVWPWNQAASACLQMHARDVTTLVSLHVVAYPSSNLQAFLNLEDSGKSTQVAKNMLVYYEGYDGSCPVAQVPRSFWEADIIRFLLYGTAGFEPYALSVLSYVFQVMCAKRDAGGVLSLGYARLHRTYIDTISVRK